ncbi:MAG TPA: hypothetical protein DCE76_11165 [Anaerolineaceae bacterium]|nr:hypothetical protein [Anaerolineaceae bacterium]
MRPEEYFAELAGSIGEQDEQKILKILSAHVGEENAIDLKSLTIQAFGEYTTSTERKTRLVLESLVTKYHVPVGAYSGKAGRFICKDDEEIERVTADLEARKQALEERIRALRGAEVMKIERIWQAGLWR